MLAINEVLRGRYRIIKQLGHGGMGAVYEAHDNVFDTTIALKEILVDLTKVTTPKQQQLVRHAFEREAKILAMVKHEAFPHVRDYFLETDRQYLVMELVDGEDLGSLLQRRHSAFPIANVMHWAFQLLDALDYLHTLTPPIIHRDIKPQNLKLTSRGKIKLLDFGIAKGAGSDASTSITNQTFVAATLNYSPLEQILRVMEPTFQEVIIQKYSEQTTKVLKQAADARSDLYALGATVYHLLTNVLPVDALKRSLEIWAGKPDPLKYPSDLNAEIPRELSDWILKAMELEHDRRFASAMEMQTALQNALEGDKSGQQDASRAQWLEEERRRAEEQKRQSEEQTQFYPQDIKMQFDTQQHHNATTERNISFPPNSAPPNNEIGSTISASAMENPYAQQPPVSNPSFGGANQPYSSFPNANAEHPTGINMLSEETKINFIPTNFNSFDTGTSSKKKKSKMIWLLPIGFLLLLFLGVGVAGVWMLMKPDAETSNTNSNPNTTKSPAQSNSPTDKPAELQPPDGMVLVEGGSFKMGLDTGNVAEMPSHTVSVKSFYIDKFEVTREEYAKCVAAKECRVPEGWQGDSYAPGTAKLPVVGVNYSQANDYARWAGKRLPTEEEWEYAARGKENRLFPWGDKWEKDKANANGASKEFSEVGKFGGTSPFGAYDMVGNAWEWTSSEFKAYPNGKLPAGVPQGDVRVIRGGSFESDDKFASTTYRAGWLAVGAPTYQRTSFRCAKDLKP